MEYGTGWGRTRHILVEVDGSAGLRKKAVCGAPLNTKVPEAEVMAKPICNLCARARRINLCSHCGGTGQEPTKVAT